jgi:transposase
MFSLTMKTNPLHAALDLHARHCVLGTMSDDGKWLGSTRFVTTEDELSEHLRALSGSRVRLTIEAGPLTPWAARIARPLVERLIVCEPRENRLISTSTRKNDSFDTRQLCRLLRLGELHEVWLGQDDGRQALRCAVYDMLKLRNQQRRWKTLLKARFRQWGVLDVEGQRIFSTRERHSFLARLPAHAPRALFDQLYLMYDTCIGAWKSALREVVRMGRAYPEIRRLRKVPGIGIIGAHVFVAIIEDPTRFGSPQALWRYSRLSIVDRSSDGKPLGYERLERRGHGELKNLSYHAWRTACRSTTQSNAIQRFYHDSLERTGGNVRHARLNTQRKILALLWTLWRKNREYDEKLFLPYPPEPSQAHPRLAGKRRTGSAPVTGKQRPSGKPVAAGALPTMRLAPSAPRAKETPGSLNELPRRTLSNPTMTLEPPGHNRQLAVRKSGLPDCAGQRLSRVTPKNLHGTKRQSRSKGPRTGSNLARSTDEL